MTRASIAVVGAGAIGRAHAELVARGDIARLVGIADPAPAARVFAEGLGVPWFADHRAMLDAVRPEMAIVATPNQLHLPVALDAIDRGIATLVEKPVATTVAEGEALAEAAAKADVPVLVGHHRRHNPIIREARRLIGAGAIGRPTTAAVLYTFFKPESYFELAWRREAGGGPVLINLIHEIDLVRFLLGEIASVQAVTSSDRRGFAVEDSAAVVLRLVGGVLVTLTLSDTTVAPWSWDLAAGESANYPSQPQPVHTHFLAGTDGSLTLPTLDLWTYRGEKSWFAPLTRETIAIERGDPYQEQLRHLIRVGRREEAPLVSAADATRTLTATLAVHEAAATGRTVVLSA